jgi:hypothetical protein
VTSGTLSLLDTSPVIVEDEEEEINKLNIPVQPLVHPSETSYPEFENISEFNDALLHDAIRDDEGSLSPTEKARTLQMIMQCCCQPVLNSLDRDFMNEVREHPANSPLDAISWMKEIEMVEEDLHMLNLKWRVLLTMLAQTVGLETSGIQREMDDNKARRKRQRNSEQLPPIPNKGLSAKSRALQNILQRNNRISMSKLRHLTKMGETFQELCAKLGYYVLMVLPGCTTYLHEIKLRFSSECHPTLSKNIEPSE